MSKKPDYQALYRTAENQAGYFTSSQAKESGYSWERLSSSTSNSKFQRIERGVFRISLFPASPFEDMFIALLKSGPHAVISHDSALSVYDLSDALPGDIHITFPRTSSRRRRGITYHTKRITQAEVTSYQGLKVTTVSRTIIDLVESGFDPIQTKMAIDQAIDRGLMTKDELLAQVRNKSESIHRTVRFYLEGEMK